MCGLNKNTFQACLCPLSKSATPTLICKIFKLVGELVDLKLDGQLGDDASPRSSEKENIVTTTFTTSSSDATNRRQQAVVFIDENSVKEMMRKPQASKNDLVRAWSPLVEGDEQPYRPHQ